MSTRAYIARERRTGEYECIFNHSNGDPESLGRILKRNFKTKEAVMLFLDGGDVEYIHPATGKVVRGKDAVTSNVMRDVHFWQMIWDGQADYVYIFSKGAWKAYNFKGNEVKIA